MQRHLSSRRGFLAGLCAALAAPALVRAASFEYLSGAAFGTRWQISGPGGAGLDRLRPALEALFASIDFEMSPWRADSEISRFNASTFGLPAGAETHRVVQAALALADASEGAFDPTVGPLVGRWGFGPIAQGAAPNWRGLALNEGRIEKTQADLTLDLCGIAKGRALDRAMQLAQNQGFEHLLLDLGGELRALGRHPEGRDWHVAIEHPLASLPAPAVLHLPQHMAVATSGLSAQSYMLKARIWGHIIDPTRAEPVQGKLRSVTVLASDAMTADGWATALFAAGDDAGPALASANDIASVFFYDTGSALRRVEVGGISEVLT